MLVSSRAWLRLVLPIADVLVFEIVVAFDEVTNKFYGKGVCMAEAEDASSLSAPPAVELADHDCGEFSLLHIAGEALEEGV